MRIVVGLILLAALALSLPPSVVTHLLVIRGWRMRSQPMFDGLRACAVASLVLCAACLALTFVVDGFGGKDGSILLIAVLLNLLTVASLRRVRPRI